MERYATFHDIAGQSVFVTGGGSGIGAALTEGFLREGAKVAFVQRSDATDFCDEMEKTYGNRPLFLPCDIRDVPALKSAMDEAVAANGPITVLVNNAAHDMRHETEGFPVEEWDRMMEVNLRPHFYTAEHAVAGMRAAGGGSIINFSSISYMMGNAGYHSYVAAKAGIMALTRGLAREYGPVGIRANAVMPGWVLTQRQMDLWASPEALAAFLDKQCLKEHLVEEDIVHGVLFLASKTSRMMTAQALVIDGGVVMTG